MGYKAQLSNTMQVLWQCRTCFAEFVMTHFSIDIIADEVPRQTCRGGCRGNDTRIVKLKQCVCGAMLRSADSDAFLMRVPAPLSTCSVCGASELEASWYDVTSIDPVNRKIYADYVANIAAKINSCAT